MEVKKRILQCRMERYGPREDRDYVVMALKEAISWASAAESEDTKEDGKINDAIFSESTII